MFTRVIEEIEIAYWNCIHNVIVMTVSAIKCVWNSVQYNAIWYLR
jgi:hypothetical protein